MLVYNLSPSLYEKQIMFHVDLSTKCVKTLVCSRSGPFECVYREHQYIGAQKCQCRLIWPRRSECWPSWPQWFNWRLFSRTRPLLSWLRQSGHVNRHLKCNAPPVLVLREEGLYGVRDELVFEWTGFGTCVCEQTCCRSGLSVWLTRKCTVAVGGV